MSVVFNLKYFSNTVKRKKKTTHCLCIHKRYENTHTLVPPLADLRPVYWLLKRLREDDLTWIFLTQHKLFRFKSRTGSVIEMIKRQINNFK